MYINETLTISDSLYELLGRRQKDSVCVRAIWRGIQSMRSGRKTTILASKFPGDFFSFRESEGMISYMPKGKMQDVSVDGLWKRKGRQSMKPSRWIKLMLSQRLARRLKDHLYAEFNDIVRHEESKGALEFKEVGIHEGYSSFNFVTGIDSCMWDDPVELFYGAFDCSILVASKPKGKYLGRALVWHGASVEGSDEKITLMDRVYCAQSNGEVLLAFKEHAIKMGWWRKSHQNNDLSKGFILPDGESRPGVIGTTGTRLEVAAKGSLESVTYFPYLDTFRYGDGKWLSNRAENSEFMYQDAHGTLLMSHAMDVQDWRGRWINRETAVRINRLYYRPDDPVIARCAISGELMNRQQDGFMLNFEDYDAELLVEGVRVPGPILFRRAFLRDHNGGRI